MTQTQPPTQMTSDLNAAGFDVMHNSDTTELGYPMNPDDDSTEDEARWDEANQIMAPYGYHTDDTLGGLILDGYSTCPITPTTTP